MSGTATNNDKDAATDTTRIPTWLWIVLIIVALIALLGMLFGMIAFFQVRGLSRTVSAKMGTAV